MRPSPSLRPSSTPPLPLTPRPPAPRHRYAQAAVLRIFYSLDPLRTGAISGGALRASPLLAALRSLDPGGDASDDINAERRYFSYEHFYVLFCAFCRLDDDRDGLLSLRDLQRYGNFGLSGRIAQRVFDARRCARAILRRNSLQRHLPRAISRSLTHPFPFPLPRSGADGMDFGDFAWFVLSEEDKTSRTACGYWFRLLDLDDDGVISPAEMEYFYEEQAQRQMLLSQEPVAFANVVTQLLDAIKPRAGGTSFTLADVRRSQMCGLLVHTLCNINKFLLAEMSDTSTPRQPGGWTDWDRFAAAEYNRLLLEEDEQQGEGGFDENELEHDDEDEPLFQVDAEGLGDGGEADRMM